MYISDRSGLTLRALLSKQTCEGSLPYPFNARKALFLNLGRNCIYLAIDLMGLKPGDVILLPAYLDDTVIEPFLIRKITTKFYRIGRDLKVDLEDISLKIDNRTKGLLAINYFGFPQPLPRLQELCKAHNMYFIEDNTHGFLSRMGDKYLGSFGDVSIFSIRKTIPSPDGAVLVINNPSLQEFNIPLRQPNRLGLYLSAADLLLRDLQSRWNLEILPVAIVFRYLLGKILPQYGNFAISNLSMKIIGETDFQYVYEHRRANFKFISEKIKNLRGIEPIYEQLPNGVCPWGFPILISNRQMVRRKLKRLGITLPIHWILPKHIPPDEFPDSRFLSEHILTLPVFQGIEKRKLSTLLDIIEACGGITL